MNVNDQPAGVMSIFPYLSRSLSLLPRRDRLLLVPFALIHISLTLLDILAVVLMGATVSAATLVIQSRDFPDWLQSIVDALGLQSVSPQALIGLMGLTVTFILLFKSIFSYVATRRIYAFLSYRDSTISSQFSKEVFGRDYSDVSAFSAGDYQYSLTLGVSAILSGIIGQSILLTSEIILQVGMSITLFIVSPILSVVCLTLLLTLFVFLYKSQGKKATYIGRESGKNHIRTLNLLADLLGAYKEIIVLGIRDKYLRRIFENKRENAKLAVSSQMLGYTSKYAFDVSVILLALTIGFFAFYTQDAPSAMATVAIFLTAITRLAPSILRVQQGLVGIKGSIGAANRFYQLYDYRPTHISSSTESGVKIDQEKQGEALASDFKESVIRIEGLYFRFPGMPEDVLRNINMKIYRGETCSIVGPSGAGKTTLVDLLLGVRTPRLGNIVVFGRTLAHGQSEPALRISYVPQFVHISDSDILRNVALGQDDEEIDLAKVRRSLDLVGLSAWVDSLPNQENSLLGEHGSRLSGGQKQRIGIARALYFDPEILVLDEATSSLDADSEASISNAIKHIGDKTDLTIIIIAHRLSTVRTSDQIVYLSEGEIKGKGDFDQLRASLPDFHRQANLMGID